MMYMYMYMAYFGMHVKKEAYFHHVFNVQYRNVRITKLEKTTNSNN